MSSQAGEASGLRRRARDNGSAGDGEKGVAGSGGEQHRSRSPTPQGTLLRLVAQPSASAVPSRSGKARRCLLWAALIVGALLGSFALFVAAVVYSDRVGVPVLAAIVRQNMPRPIVRDATTAASTSEYANFGEMISAAYRRFSDLRIDVAVHGTRYHTYRPSTGKYGKHQWLWDSALHMRINTHRSLDDAVSDLFALLSHQDDATGFVPEMVYWHPDPNQAGIARLLLGYSSDKRTDITQMPILAFALDGMVKKVSGSPAAGEDAGNRRMARMKLLCQTLPRLHKYHMWWLQRRDADADSLVSIVHPWESGLDASPLYDDAHRFNRLLRAKVDSTSNATTWGGDGSDGRVTRPTPDELYPEFIVLLYRYRNRAKWQQARIFDPEFAQEQCPASVVPPPKDPKELQRRARQDRRAAAWQVSAKSKRLRERLASLQKNGQGDLSAARYELAQGSIADGIFDVEDAGLNAVLAANMLVTADLIDLLIKDLEALSSHERDTFVAWATTKDACCWSRDAHVRRSFTQRVRDMREKAGEMRRAASVIISALTSQSWDDDAQQFHSFCHVYHRLASGGGCMEQRTLARDTIQGLFPLLLGHRIGSSRVEALLAKLEDPLQYGPSATGAAATTPTVSRRERDVYETGDSTLMWRGPSWPTTNWFVARGLQTVVADEALPQGLRDRAAQLHRDLIDRWVRMHLHHGFFEYHNPETGAGLGQKGLGMSHTLVDILLSSIDAVVERSALLSRSAREALLEDSNTKGDLQRLRAGLEHELADTSSDLWRTLDTGVVSAKHPGLPGTLRDRLFPTPKDLGLVSGRTTHSNNAAAGTPNQKQEEDGSVMEDDEGPAADGDDDDEEEELLPMSVDSSEWRLRPKLVHGLCW